MTTLPPELMRAASGFLSGAEQIHFQEVARATQQPAHVRDRIYTDIARKAPPLAGRDVVIADNGAEHILPGQNLSSQQPITLTTSYDNNTPSQDRLNQIKGKKCYLNQLVLNAPQTAGASLGSYVKDLIKASTYIRKLSIDKDLFPLSDELLTLIEKNKSTIDSLAFDLTEESRECLPRLNAAGFTQLSLGNLGFMALYTLTKKR